ncbi:UDP-glucose 4-epimerase GalE [Lysobacter sp. P5_B9]
MKILVCGGSGYIGSHTCLALLQAGHEVVAYDNFSNSSPVALDRVMELSGKKLDVVEGDIRDRATLESALADGIDAVIHFAALKAVGESCERPLDYFDNNISGTICLLQAMEATSVNRLVFSSSATVYGDPNEMPVTEAASLHATNPYGRTKLVAEQLIGDLCAAMPFNAVLLRYFNPVGAHPSGRIGEDPSGVPNNLMPYVAQVAVGLRGHLSVLGDDYPTRDGTGVRDYIHVMDLAEAHVRAVELAPARRCLAVNVGTGKGYSVLEVVEAFERASGRSIPYQVVARRPGDVAECYANPLLAREVLGWSAKYDLDRMCEDMWRWQSANPHGYRGLAAPEPTLLAIA